MISIFATKHLPKGTYQFGDVTKGTGGTKVSGYEIDRAGLVTLGPDGNGFLNPSMWLKIPYPHPEYKNHNITLEFYYLKTPGVPMPSNFFKLRLSSGGTVNLDTSQLESEILTSVSGFHKISITFNTVTNLVDIYLNSDYINSVVFGHWFNVNTIIINIMLDISVLNLVMYDEAKYNGTDYESVDLEVTESVGWDFVGSGENPLSSGFDSIDPTLNMTSASLDVPARAVLKGNLTHPSKMLDIRLTSRATLGDKPINVEFNGVTKTITPTGTYKYGELIFQVEDVPAGDFEIIITKEL